MISDIRVLHQDYVWHIADIHKLKYPNIARQAISYHPNIVWQEKKKSKTDKSSIREDQDCSMIDMVVT